LEKWYQLSHTLCEAILALPLEQIGTCNAGSFDTDQDSVVFRHGLRAFDGFQHIQLAEGRDFNRNHFVEGPVPERSRSIVG
jgi:hypothetical protein